MPQSKIMSADKNVVISDSRPHHTVHDWRSYI